MVRELYEKGKNMIAKARINLDFTGDYMLGKTTTNDDGYFLIDAQDFSSWFKVHPYLWIEYECPDPLPWYKVIIYDNMRFYAIELFI